MWLTVRRGRAEQRRVEITGERFLAGRAEDCDLRLLDDNASRWHAYFESLPDGRVVVNDLDSANGTFVDGRRVDSATLEGGEQIQLGDTVLVCSREEPEEQQPTGAGGQSRSAVLRSVMEGSGLRQALRADSAIRRAIEAPRSARRAAIVASLATAAAVIGALFLFGVLPPGRSAADVVDEVAASTALIQVYDEAGGRLATGSGWVLDSSAGLVVTNAHVVNAGERFEVSVEGRARGARLLGAAPCEDLAVLKVDDIAGLRSLALGSQAEIRPGDAVVAVGYPGNASAKDELTSTEGIVSVVNTAYREPSLDVPHYPNVVQTDAAINPGNSGGPLLDLDARLVGVNSAGRTESAEGRAITGQGYAIGVDRARAVLATLRQGRSIGWVGFGFGYPTDQVLAGQRLPPGLFVEHVAEGSPAARAGLGDERPLLVEVDGRPIDNSLQSYCAALGEARSGQQVRLGLLSPGSRRPRNVSVTLP